jgi:hypothetical protein
VSDLDLDAITQKWLQTCGYCDAGLPMACICPPTSEDYRVVMADLVDEVARLRKQTVSPTLYKVGDPDPTPPDDARSDDWCLAEHPDGYCCIWPEGHAHPQHIDSNDGVLVAVWPA